jgi:hypothetical protein
LHRTSNRVIPLAVFLYVIGALAYSSLTAYNVTWRFVFGVTAVMLIAGALIHVTLFLLDEQKVGMPVYQVNLNSVPAELNSRNGFIELMGQAARRYTEPYRQGSSLEVFVPICRAPDC